MMLAKILEEMMGDGSAEFERVTIMLPIDTLEDAFDLAGQIGIPRNRLLAELILAGLPEARSEWRRLALNEATPEPARTGSHPSFSIDPTIYE